MKSSHLPVEKHCSGREEKGSQPWEEKRPGGAWPWWVAGGETAMGGGTRGRERGSGRAARVGIRMGETNRYEWLYFINRIIGQYSLWPRIGGPGGAHPREAATAAIGVARATS